MYKSRTTKATLYEYLKGMKNSILTKSEVGYYFFLITNQPPAHTGERGAATCLYVDGIDFMPGLMALSSIVTQDNLTIEAVFPLARASKPYQ